MYIHVPTGASPGWPIGSTNRPHHPIAIAKPVFGGSNRPRIKSYTTKHTRIIQSGCRVWRYNLNSSGLGSPARTPRLGCSKPWSRSQVFPNLGDLEGLTMREQKSRYEAQPVSVRTVSTCEECGCGLGSSRSWVFQKNSGVV